MRFYGTIITGRQAGKYMRSDSPWLNVAFVSEPYPREYVEYVPTLDVETYVSKYKHQKMTWANTDTGERHDFGFWVPVDVKNPQVFILEELLKSYNENASKQTHQRRT